MLFRSGDKVGDNNYMNFYLHSTVVLLSPNLYGIEINPELYLHSTVVLLSLNYPVIYIYNFYNIYILL